MSYLFQDGRINVNNNQLKNDTEKLDINISDWSTVSVKNFKNMFEGADIMEEKFEDNETFTSQYSESQRSFLSISNMKIDNDSLIMITPI